MGTFINLIKENIKYRHQMWELANYHQKKMYKGSDMGLIWAFAKPSVYIVVFYVAITIGFRSSKDIPGLICPYFVWLCIGMIAFFYMRDMLLNGAFCFRRYSHFVARAKYPIGTMPTTMAVSYMKIHLGMLLLGFIIAVIFGCRPSLYWLQLPFYMALMFIFAVFWTIATGIISVVYKDFYNFLQVANQMVFWLSAILFDVNGLSPTAQKVFWFNPITFIVEGYRNSLCRHVWFFDEPIKLACYMLMLVLMGILAMVMYRKLRKRIPDLL